MRTFAFVLACVACSGYGRRVHPQHDNLEKGAARLEAFIMDASTLAQEGMEEHLERHAARGKEATLCQVMAATNPAAAFQAGGSGLSAPLRARRAAMSPRMSVGLYYSTSTGNTETVAEYIAGAAGIEDWKDIGDADDAEITGHDAIIVGAPTWHTGADSERSGTSWDEWLYNTLPNLDFSGKKVAIFGVGDSGSYSDNFCDAAGELYDLFTGKGAKVFGMTPSDEGYDYTESKSVVDDKFVGRMFDEDSYSDESEERAKSWVEQLKSEGFM